MTRRLLRAVSVVLLLHAGGLLAAGKTGRGYYTDKRLETMRKNVETYDWAKRMKANLISATDKWLACSDDDLRLMVPPPELARAAYVHETGCPKHGLAIRKFGTYAWKLDLAHPFKVQCPVDGEFYPDNDFNAYYRSGIVNGRFRPEKADRSLLKGGIVDDGWGWDRPDDQNPRKYWFVAYYVHWMLIQRVVIPVMRDCSQAYLVTGDERYAHKAAVVLWQLAEYYPEYRYEKQSSRGTEIDHGYVGKLLYHTWETFTVDAVAMAYDAVAPSIEKDQTLQRLTGQSAEQIREHIEGRMLREMARLIMDGSHTIQGNYGMHQCALLNVALACGDEEHKPKRSEMVDWILNNDNVSLYTDMSLNDALYNIVFRDGVPFESPGYNLSWVQNLLGVAERLDQCGVEVFSWPRLKRLLDWPIDMTCCGRFSPSLGDSGNMYELALGRSGTIYAPAYRHYRDPRYAQLFATIEGTPTHDLFEECLDDEIAKAAKENPGELGVGSFLFPAYGMTILQTGSEANRTAVMLHQGSGRTAHSHFDNLHVDFFSHRHALTPDFGYPETCNSEDPRRFGFFCHTLSHNTVMVNQGRGGQAVGTLTVYDPTGFCKVVEARSEGTYPGLVRRYQRTVALVDASPDEAYVVDVFRVAGGRQHDWILHGTDADFETTLPLSKPRTEGTLAGPEVKYGHFYDNETMGRAPYGATNYYPYVGSAFMYLFNVQEAPLTGAACASWKLKTSGEQPLKLPPTQGVVLRAHMIGDGETAFVCEGKPQQNCKYTPETVKFLLRRRQGEDLSSAFVTVFEPYKDKPFLRSVSRVQVTPADGRAVALKIEKVGGGADYFFNSAVPAGEYQAEGTLFRGQCAALTVNAEGQVERAHLVNGGVLRKGDFSLQCAPPQTVKIASVDYKSGAITLAQPVLADKVLEGRWVVISNDLHSTIYRIEKVLGPAAFSIGSQDPRCGRLLPMEYAPEKKLLKTSNFSSFTQPGMHIADEANTVLGKVTAAKTRDLTIEAPQPVALSQLPDTDRDGRRRVWVMDFAPGDEVTLGTSVSYQKQP